MKKIAIYGKGGIGKSTTTSNLSAAFSEEGLKVCQIGCDPKNDSTRLLLGRICSQTVLDMVRDNDEVAAEDIVHTGYNGIKCVEAGGPEPGVGCAGRGIIVALEKLRSLEVLTDEDLIMYDVLGDVVCGGKAISWVCRRLANSCSSCCSLGVLRPLPMIPPRRTPPRIAKRLTPLAMLLAAYRLISSPEETIYISVA